MVLVVALTPGIAHLLLENLSERPTRSFAQMVTNHFGRTMVLLVYLNEHKTKRGEVNLRVSAFGGTASWMFSLGRKNGCGGASGLVVQVGIFDRADATIVVLVIFILFRRGLLLLVKGGSCLDVTGWTMGATRIFIGIVHHPCIHVVDGLGVFDFGSNALILHRVPKRLVSHFVRVAQA